MRSLIVLAALVLVGCSDPAHPAVSSVAPSTSSALAPGPLVGVGMTPLTYEGTGFPDFLEQIDGNTDLLMHAGGWDQAGIAGSAVDVASALAEQRGLKSVIVFGSPVDGSLDALRTFLTAHHPAYLGLANEVNLLATDDPAAFEAVATFWQQAVPVVRELSPDTKVFVTFQYEWLLGRRDGWFGGTQGDAQWDVLDRFPGADLVGLTTYPSLVLEAPADLPPVDQR